MVPEVKNTLISARFWKKKDFQAYWGHGGCWGCRGQRGWKCCRGQKMTHYNNPKHFLSFWGQGNNLDYWGHWGYHGLWGQWGQWGHSGHMITQIHIPDDICHLIWWLEKGKIIGWIQVNFKFKMASCRTEVTEAGWG